MNTGTGATAPDIVDALVLLGESELDEAVRVSDAVMANDVPQEYFIVGFNGDEEGEAIRTEFVRADAAFGDLEETEIDCQFSAWVGDTDPKVARDRAYSFLNSITDAFRIDQTMGKACANIRVVRAHCVQAPDTAGSVATIYCTFRAEAWRRP